MSSAPSAKDIHVAPISGQDARALVRSVHYSGKVKNNSQLHLGVFLNGKLEGAMQFGPSNDKAKVRGLVRDTPWNGFLELNRLAFREALPRNSESRALAVAFRLIRKHYPHIQWVVSFADGTQCGDGAIYRASGFVLTAARRNSGILRLPDGSVIHKLGVVTGKNKLANYAKTRGASSVSGGVPLDGFQFRYIYFIDPTARARLAVPEVPFSRIDELDARMVRGKKIARPWVASCEIPSCDGGSTPTRTLQSARMDRG